MRKDHDLLGEKDIPDDIYYGAQTIRALELFKQSKETVDKYPSFIQATGNIKKANAIVHCELGILSEYKSKAIVSACEELIEGKLNKYLVLDMLSGNDFAPVHMNMNEVIACRANELLTGKKGYEEIHPNTHVNMGQSTCDAMYTAVKIGIYFELGSVIEVIKGLSEEYRKLSVKYKNCIKVAHTCLQDALPTTFGLFYGASHSLLERHIGYLEEIRKETLGNTVGYTVIGTGLGSFSGYHERINVVLSELIGAECYHVENPVADLQYGDLYMRISGILKSVMTSISKMAKDIRLMTSGPHAGFSEISIAPVQNGSSFFPGKINPSLAELVMITTYQVCGADTSITMAVENGELDVTPWYPVFAVNIFNQCTLITNTVSAFSEKCVSTIKVNENMNQYKAERSLGMAPIVTAMFGYENAVEVAKYAAEHDIPIREAVVMLGLLDECKANEIFAPLLTTDVEKSSRLLYELADKKR